MSNLEAVTESSYASIINSALRETVRYAAYVNEPSETLFPPSPVPLRHVAERFEDLFNALEHKSGGYGGPLVRLGESLLRMYAAYSPHPGAPRSQVVQIATTLICYPTQVLVTLERDFPHFERGMLEVIRYGLACETAEQKQQFYEDYNNN